MNTPNPVDIQNLSRAYGARAALNNISLQVATGTVFGLVGENGGCKPRCSSTCSVCSGNKAPFGSSGMILSRTRSKF